MSVDNGFERYVSCPYEINHQILLSRLQFHVEKCKKSYVKGQRMLECPFNATHKVPEIEFNCHKAYLCPDRSKLETFMCSTQDSAKLFPIANIIVQSSENWDDVEVPTYNPEDHCKTMPVMVNKIGAKPSERKYHRSEERERFRNFASGPSTAPVSRPSSGPSRLPQTQSRSFVAHDIRKASIPEETFQPEQVTAVPSVSCNQNVDDQGFIMPKYSRGRGRGRIMQN